jgi:hypothetical protein
MFIDNEFMSDDAFVEWLAQKKYVLQHTGIKNQQKLYLDGEVHLVNGLQRTTRKRLKIEEKPHSSYYKLHISPRVDFATLFQLDAVRDVPGSPTRV